MMFNIKNTIFNFLTPRQKSALLSQIRSFVKKQKIFNREDIVDRFIEEETYYLNINSSRFEFLEKYLSDEEFLRDLKVYIDSIICELKQKEALKPIIEKQKQILKEQRKRANDYKMSKLKPTKKQVAYYEKITRAHGIEMKNIENATRLDLRNWIMEIIEPEENLDE